MGLKLSSQDLTEGVMFFHVSTGNMPLEADRVDSTGLSLKRQ